MAAELLLDTGGLVSLLDRGQHNHQSVLDYFQEWKGEVVSTEAVLAESTHLLGRVSHGRQACIEFFLRGGAVLVPSSGASLLRARQLIDQYADLPMDYADATLVVLAEELATNLILTTDRRDFQIYRIAGSTAFEIVPG
ncbi:MAG: type II toxin-antitoxin system VapC family toxin [Acidobacteriota bacterium]